LEKPDLCANQNKEAAAARASSVRVLVPYPGGSLSACSTGVTKSLLKKGRIASPENRWGCIIRRFHVRIGLRIVAHLHG